MTLSLLDQLWILLGAFLVFMMQGGFLCLESGLTRSKNAINVAMKNLADFAVAVSVFWVVGFGLMFGDSSHGLWGADRFLAALGAGGEPGTAAFFLFQAMFCATAATIVSGAVAERMTFSAYLAVALLVALPIYPLYGHWAWGGVLGGAPGWLARFGFVDFAGATVVHGVGGWVALAAVLRLGPRTGRFAADAPPRPMPAGNLPMAMLGGLLLFVGWFGFNGGSTLGLDERVPGVLVNTTLAGVAGILSGLALGWRLRRYAEVLYALNGAIAGLVAITAGAHVMSAAAAVLTGAIGGLVMVLSSELLLRLRIDDAVGAIPAHLFAGIWGTLAVALLGDPALFGTGLGRGAQLAAQGVGVAVCGAWAFALAWFALGVIGRGLPLRVSAEGERLGLNVAEHGTRTELHELLETMRRHERSGDVSGRVPVEPFTEVGEIAASYNRVVDALERAVARTRVVMRNLRDGVVTWGRDGVLTGFNPGAEALFGVPADDAIGAPLSGLLRCDPPAAGERCELRVRHPDGGMRVLEIQVSEGVSGTDSEFAGMVRDVTERKRLEEQLHRERDLAQVTLASIGDGVITTDAAGAVSFMNAEAERLTGWRLADARLRSVGEVYRLLEDEGGRHASNSVRRVLASGQAVVGDQTRELRGRDGRRFPVRESAAPIRSREGFVVGAVVVFQDVTVTRELAARLRHQASHDALTGLANRREFEQRLEALIQRREGQHVLCYLDLDQFKIVNDTCGHAAGDELLRQIAVLLRGHLRGSDILARLGGDEFGIVFRDCGPEQAQRQAEAIRAGVQQFRFAWGERTFAVGISLGLVPVGGEASLSLGEALTAADTACYAAKEAGRNRIHVYRPHDSALARRYGEVAWVSRLQAALDDDRFRLFAQPIRSVQEAGGPPHHEILVRMESEDGGLIGPGAFMPAAERFNLMPPIDRWVVRNTLAWLRDASRREDGAGIWSINLSGASLSDEHFLAELHGRVAEADLPPRTLCFEITESAAVARLTRAAEFMREMRQLGCTFALDDFGSGLSSFAYLKHLPVDYLKIDGTFVRDVDTDPIDRALVEAINAVGHTMGLATIAEFVETGAILERLRAIGVDHAQGFHLGRPRPLVEMARVTVMPR